MRLTVIQSPDFSLEGMRGTGLLERHALLMREYARHFEVDVFTSDSADFSKSIGVRHHYMKHAPASFGAHHLAYYSWLVAQTRQMGDVVKVFGSNIPSLPVLRALSGKPMMVTYQYDYAEQTRQNERSGLKYHLAPLAERASLRGADLVLVTTARLQRKVERMGGLRTLLLPNWVQLPLPEEFGAGPRQPLSVMYAGRLHWSKGLAVLLEAFQEVQASAAGATLTLCGDGELRGQLEGEIRSLGLRNVVMTGGVPHSEIMTRLRATAVFALPTLTMEGHPKALIEAMAAGAACVATDVPGNADVIADGRNGLLVPSGNASALAGAILRALGDEGLRSQLSRAAQESVRECEFSTVVNKEVAVLQELANNGARQQHLPQRGPLTNQAYWASAWRRQPRSRRSLRAPWHKDWLEFQRSVLPREHGLRLLEVGCAASRWLPVYAKDFSYRVTGIDFDPVGCDLARRALSEHGAVGEVLCGDFFSLAASLQERFDVVVSYGFLEHFDGQQAAHALGACLRSGGTLFATVPNLHGVPGLLGFASENWRPTHVAYTLEKLRRVFKEAGFEDVTCAYAAGYGVPVPRPRGWRKALLPLHGAMWLYLLAAHGTYLLTGRALRGPHTASSLMLVAKKPASHGAEPGPAC